jgi:hypothetical protein
MGLLALVANKSIILFVICHVDVFRSLPQRPKKIHVYTREICNCLYFQNLTLFNFFLMSVDAVL